MTRSEVAKLVTLLSAAYPAAQMTEATCQAYERMLADMDLEPAKAAVARLIATCRFLPTIAEIRAAAVEEACGPKRTGIEAWGDVTRAVRYVGRYEQPTFEDPLVTRAVDCMGWRNLCDSTNETADRARFAELYEDLQGRARSDMQAGRALPEPRRGYRLTAGEQQEKLLTEKQQSAREGLRAFDAGEITVGGVRVVVDNNIPSNMGRAYVREPETEEELAARLEMLREQARKLVAEEPKETP